MIAHGEYAVEKAISSGARSEVWRARRVEDDESVVLKTYRNDRLPDGRSQARREFEALRAVESEGIVRALDLLEDTAPPALVLELLPGGTLASWVADGLPPLDAVLAVGARLARALAAVHAHRLIHRDLSPANIQVDPETRAAHLLDFGSARTLGSARGEHVSASRSRSRGFGAGLAFMSPEQTGRMDRGVDSRSDLYSLGACLYFALSGRPPFDLADTLALLHAHLARVPDPLHVKDARVPVAVSRIVAKLLEKEPEQRYQSGRALAQDLDACLERLRQGGPIPDDLALGAADAPTRPVFRQVVYGRDAEIAHLRAAFTEVCAGSMRVVFVGGGAGTGKSSLVGALRSQVADAGGHVASGTCDRYQNAGVQGALRSALGSLTDQMLCAGEEHFDGWRSELSAALGDLAGVATDFVPGLGAVLGDVPGAPPLAPRQASVRLALTLERLLRVCARKERPLVLVIDDLHFASRESLALLEPLIGAAADSALLWVLAYRADAPGAARALFDAVTDGDLCAAVSDVELAPLPRSALAAMIGDALGSSPEAVAAIVDAAERKTDGSPLLVRELVLHLHAEGRIRADPETGFTWDDAEIAAAEIHEGAVSMMCAKLERLPETTRALASFASCLRDEFDASWIARVREEEVGAVERELFVLADAGLLAPSPAGFRFAHERIREAANGLLEAGERARIHDRTARALLASTPFERLGERAAEISGHLQAGSALVDAELRATALAIHLAAGERDLSSGAFDAGRAHLAAGRALLRDEDWATDPRRAFALLHESVEAELLAGDLDAALALADALVARDLEGLERCRALAKRLRVLGACDAPNVIDELLAALRSYGIHWRSSRPRWRMWLQVKWLDWRLRGPLDERAFRPGDPSGLARMAPLLLLSEVNTVLVRRGSTLITESICFWLGLMLRVGTVRPPALPLAAYAAARIEVLGHWRGLKRYVDAAGHWAAKGSDRFSFGAQMSLCMFSLVWLRPRRELLAPLRGAMRGLHEHGDLDHTRAAFFGQLAIAAVIGRPLDELLASAEESRRFRHWPQVGAFLRVYSRAYVTLGASAGARSDWCAVTRELEPDMKSILLYGRIHWLLVLALFEQYELVWAELERTLEVEYYRGPVVLPEFHLLRGLCAAERASKERGLARRRALRRLRRDERWLFARAEQGPDFAPAAAFLRAETTRLVGTFPQTLHAYGEAVEAARRAEYVHIEAWLHERRARFLIASRRRRDAVPPLERAVRLYASWGAKAKVRQTRELLRSLGAG